MFVSDVPINCINESAKMYHVPAILIISVLNVEQGKVGIEKKNKNGSYDLGPMQINTSWWPKLLTYGITKHDVQYNPCMNVRVGAWILARAISDGKDLISSVGDYNSHAPQYNLRYANKVRVIYTHLHEILDEETN